MNTQATQALRIENENENKNKNNQEEKDGKLTSTAKAATTVAAVAGAAGVASSMLKGLSDETAVPANDSMPQADDNTAEATESAAEATTEHGTEAAAQTATTTAQSPTTTSQSAAESNSVTEEPTSTAAIPATETADEHIAEHHVTHEATNTATDEMDVPVDSQWLTQDPEPVIAEAPATESQAAPTINEPLTEHHEAHEPATTVTQDIDIPVDSQWLTHEQASTPAPQPEPAAVNEASTQLPPISASAMKVLNGGIGDELADKVHVSPEIFASMMNLRPADMVKTELNDDGMMHNAAVLSNDNGQQLLMVDSDNDGFLDTLTDITGHAYALPETPIRFEISTSDMNNYVGSTNPEAFTMSSQISDANVAAIVGNGDGDNDEIIFVDDSHILDAQDDDTIVDLDESQHQDDLSDLHAFSDPHHINQDNDNEHIDLTSFNDSLMV